jgi:plastocyanin
VRLATIGAAVVTAALLLTACGSSKKSSSTSSAAPASTSSTPSTGSAAKSKELELYNFRFSPKAVAVNPPGQKLKLELKNEGNVEHNFTVDSLHIDKDVPAGKTNTVTVTGPKSGVVTFYCKYHKAKGMTGAFLAGGVKSSKPPTGPPPTNTSGGSSGGGY